MYFQRFLDDCYRPAHPRAETAWFGEDHFLFGHDWKLLSVRGIGDHRRARVRGKSRFPDWQ
ncbi:hypothetical protein SLNWT_1076 [Streptomyces albus]|uniref:Uncharacterized protein n=1 Tax=Streptomyces albus (strain ATCC 21838 / DSM 41398 / FERM P-419 / JCM 4703 / NBRC 107858) TaxID=1081613 RepID=A0A0B5ETM3_STRA4|nr:hypothetical protein SLNWT_1076 [Streptomyces albus]